MSIFTVQVGWTDSRPVRPDQHTSTIRLEAGDAHEAELCALHIVAARPACVMPTSSLVIDWQE